MANTMTINQAMVLAKALRGRLAELSQLRSEVSIRTNFYSSGNKEKTVEPQYDVKKLDKMCVDIENFLLEVDSLIKESNAKTTIAMETDGRALMKALAD